MNINSLFITILAVCMALQSTAQTIKGMVADQQHQPLIGASVVQKGTTNGVITDINGRFALTLDTGSKEIIVSFTGFQADTISIKGAGPYHIMLQEKTDELNAVVVKGQSTFLDDLDAKHVEVITEAELTRAACCNLSESFETNASVDVSYSDAVSGAKTIKMLGLDGRYVQINRENIPHVRGLSGRYGLGYVPGTWIQSIDVGKGAGSVVNGFESMTGQINVELKKPDLSEKWYLNGYVNSFGRTELNANHATPLSDRVSTGILLHADYLASEIDNNEDGFMDLPKSRQINFMNRYKYDGGRIQSQIGIQMIRDEKAGGQLGFNFGDDPAVTTEYGFLNKTTRVEVFGKLGVLYPQKPYQGLGFIYSATFLDIEGGYGRRNYTGRENTLYGNVIYQNIIGNSFHQYRTGVSMLYDDFDENFADSAFSRTEVVPGIYYEYTFKPGDQFTLVAGARTDFHNLYGTYFTPRIHTKFKLGENTHLRMAAGRGYRTPNAILENSNALVSSRRLVIQENPEPEVSWNIGGSLNTQLLLGDKPVMLTADYFYTYFENQLIYDLDQDPGELNIYNLDGQSFAHSAQLEGSYSFTDELSVKAAYKYYLVKSTINEKLQQVPFTARDRFFLNANYATKYDIWEADATLQWYGSKRLPNTSAKPAEFQLNENSPSFFMLNTQISRGFRWGNIYLGAENLLDFRQDQPIIDAENPFGNEFDASMVWGPVAGRVIYAGFRYKIK